MFTQMNKATRPMQDFAKRLIDHEAKGGQSRQSDLPVAFRACEKLRSHMTTLMGKAGFGALLARSLALGAVEAPWLRMVSLRADGGWEGLEEAGAFDDKNQVAEGGVVLLARLLGLLTAFIGEPLTVGLVREIWPKCPLNDLDLKTGDAK